MASCDLPLDLENSMEIIGVCGRKRHGKDTIGGMLMDLQEYTPIAFADPIKRIGMDIYGLSYDQCYGTQEDKETVDPRWGVSPRHILQRIGTEMGRNIHPETWVRYCLKTIEKAANGEEPLVHSPKYRAFIPATPRWCNLNRWVITDCRFPNEAAAIRQVGGEIIKVVRPSLEGKQGDTHASETSIDDIEPDHLIINNGTLDDLRAKVLEAIRKAEVEGPNYIEEDD